jgi:hypothetical protein
MMNRNGYLKRLVSNHLLTNHSYGFIDRQVGVNLLPCGIDRVDDDGCLLLVDATIGFATAYG